MPVHLIPVPYDSGHRAARMGRGPLHLVGRGAPDTLRTVDPDLRVLPVEVASAFPTEIGTAFELHRAVAERVTAASRDGALPLVFSGNCNSSIGTVAGLQAASPDEPVGVIWFDGHGDSSTPETFAGDFLDAMGLSTLTGRCWQALAATVPGFRPVPDEHVILIGGHGMDEGSRRVLDRSAIANVTAANLQTKGTEAALRPALDRFRDGGVGRVYVHLDVDVLDARRVAPANEFVPVEGGLVADEVLAAVDLIAARFKVAAAAVASFDPAYDRNDRVLGAALAFLRRVAGTPDAGGVRG